MSLPRSSQNHLLNAQVKISPKFAQWDTTKLKVALYNLLMQMKCSEEKCGEPAVKMNKISEDERDLKCKDHIITVTSAYSYKEMKFYWTEIMDQLECIQRQVCEAQVLISTMESTFYKKKLKDKEIEGLVNLRQKIDKIVK